MTAALTKAREWHLVRRPRTNASPDDFALIETDVPEPGPGQVVVRNTHLSVDPYMRGRMDDRPSYIPPFPLDAPLEGSAVGVVVESRTPQLAAGQVVEHFAGLREVTVADAAAVSPIDVDGLPAEAFLGPLGPTGLSAWIGISELTAVQPGDTVFVTGAAGAVGSIAGQIARLRGAGRVIGSAGSAAKVDYLRGTYDVAFDYHDGDVREHLEQAAPDGIDVVFDNVGGVQLEAAISNLRVGARIALCGMVSQYDGREPYGVRNLFDLVTKRVTTYGFLVTDHLHRMPDFRAEMTRWLRDGDVTYHQTVLDGIERVPEALLSLLSSGAPITGKAVVRP
ncbi:NADP-dependent oxidoreductase [Micromonospora andamanensis]|uniref:NADP-dependent oxidoreductase n=1 Tax=Micromonospora andamanensis TaxID=1287068 RepID=A0ABQ4I2I2_9ACTN|nr:NADP-dependent oxidoreductase [Micromonospora andamanensis]GIJ12083.1 NADP-dependent oxidoreductase [Micromonospora andamanensis]